MECGSAVAAALSVVIVATTMVINVFNRLDLVQHVNFALIVLPPLPSTQSSP
jgi:hypothetical protein